MAIKINGNTVIPNSTCHITTNNTALGLNALDDLTTGTDNTAFIPEEKNNFFLAASAL